MSFTESRQNGTLVLENFAFHVGRTLPELTIAWTTLGAPRRNADGEIDNAVMLLHGTGGSSARYLEGDNSDALFSPGAPFDPAHSYVILPDAIGHGRSSKPSDGLRMAFPAYDYADMVEAQRRMLAHLGVKKLRIIMGMSMGGMMTFEWAVTHPDMADKFLPMAAYPIEIAGQNRMQRKLTIDAIKADPLWNDGNYTTPPLSGLRAAASIQMLMFGSPLNLHNAYPTRAATDRMIEEAMALSLGSGRDANDAIYQTDASRNYNPWDGLGRIKAPLLWINFADDLLNPVSLDIADKAVARMDNARFMLVPGTTETKGHGTLLQPTFWIDEVQRFVTG